MSHEIRTPMTGVMGMLDMLMESNVDADQSGLIRTARNSAEMLLSIINDVLDMAKLEAGKVEIARVDFDAETVLRTVCDMMAARAADKGLRFNAVLPLSARTWLKGDPDRISQILFNLLGNAVKFTDTGDVSFRARTRATDNGLDLILHVADTGIGMSEEDVERAFKEFEQIHAGGTYHSNGTGLGLAIVSRLVEAMGGTIEVDSKVGRGTAFIVTLPLEAGTPAPDSKSGDTGLMSALAGRKVLVVEDNAINRQIIGSVLSIAAVDASYVFDGAAALERLAAETFDVILMDVQMPVMDGLTATRRLREMGVATPILGLTANAMSHDRDACLDAGMNDHIAKPFRPADVLGALARALG